MSYYNKLKKSQRTNSSRVILVDPVTGCIEGKRNVPPNASADSVRHSAGAEMVAKGLSVDKIKSGNGYAG